jgi:quercetin dioxygenase-like cupin family protein
MPAATSASAGALFRTRSSQLDECACAIDLNTVTEINSGRPIEFLGADQLFEEMCMKRIFVPLALGIVAVAASILTASALATPGAEVDTTVFGRASVGPYQSGPGAFETDADGFHVATDRPSDMVVQLATIGPGGSNGWHSHPKAVFVVVTEGTLTLYSADEPTCTPHRYGPGEGFAEQVDDVHLARNDRPRVGQTPA